MADIEVAVPEIVIHESVNLLRGKVLESSQKISSAHRELSKQIGVEPIYLVSPDETAELWENQLRASFRVLPVHGDDAIEALEREALRKRPAREGRGARDSAIWLSCLRLARNGDHVYLISKNTADFADSTGGLHPELLEDVAHEPANLDYFKDLDAFVAEIAGEGEPGEPIVDPAPEPVVEAFLEQVGAEHDLFLIELTEQHRSFSISAVRRTYRIEDTGLVLVDGVISISAAGSFPLEADVTVWLTFDASSREVTSADFTKVTIRETTDLQK